MRERLAPRAAASTVIPSAPMSVTANGRRWSDIEKEVRPLVKPLHPMEMQTQWFRRGNAFLERLDRFWGSKKDYDDKDWMMETHEPTGKLRRHSKTFVSANRCRKL